MCVFKDPLIILEFLMYHIKKRENMFQKQFRLVKKIFQYMKPEICSKKTNDHRIFPKAGTCQV